MRSLADPFETERKVLKGVVLGYFLSKVGETEPQNPDYYCTECGRDKESGGRPAVCDECRGDEQ